MSLPEDKPEGPHDQCEREAHEAAEEIKRLRSLLSRYLGLIKEEEGYSYLGLWAADRFFSAAEITELHHMFSEAPDVPAANQEVKVTGGPS